jgi:hypothetical protein
MGAKTPIREQWAITQRWTRHHELRAPDAVRDLKVLKPTLLSRKNRYWNAPEPHQDTDDRFRVQGAGRKYKMAAYAGFLRHVSA